MSNVKMSETFAMPCNCRTADNGVAIDILDSYGDLLIDGENTFEETDLSAVCVAINNHDRLVQELEQSKSNLNELISFVSDIQLGAEHSYDLDALINKIQGGK